MRHVQIIEHSNLTWQNVDAAQLHQAITTELEPQTCRFIFSTSERSSSLLYDPQLRRDLAARYDLEPWFWSYLSRESSGFFRSAIRDDRPPQQPGRRSVIRFLLISPSSDHSTDYTWTYVTFVILWTESSSLCVICETFSDGVRSSVFNDKIIEDIQHYGGDALHQDPFFIHALLIRHVVEWYDKSFWSWRNVVRRQEKNRPDVKNDSVKPDYVRMHELARHIMHTSEMAAMAAHVNDTVIAEAERALNARKGNPKASAIGRALEELRYQQSLLKCIQLRSQSLQGRLSNEINLAFNVNSLQDSALSAEIARAAQADSNTAKTISVLGLLFLPGTFISAIFSMSFFNFTPASADTPQRWTVSNKFWVYWVVAVPITLFTIVCWTYWQRKDADRERSAATKPKTV